jgi:hypothetical protein
MEVKILGHCYHVTAWTSCGSGMWCVCINICMNDRALRAVKRLYICLCAVRDRMSAINSEGSIALRIINAAKE